MSRPGQKGVVIGPPGFFHAPDVQSWMLKRVLRLEMPHWLEVWRK